jgi:hypothetical protein
MALPAPDKAGGILLYEAFNKRRSHREFVATELSLDQLSQILWSAFGVNREAGKLRTIPTSHNRQRLTVYAVLSSGVWRYDGERHQLELQLSGDHTDLFGEAPLTLVYIVPTADGPVGGIHVGLAAQDVGLTCASLELGNVLKTTGADSLNPILPLPSGLRVLAVHSIGLPAGKL